MFDPIGLCFGILAGKNQPAHLGQVPREVLGKGLDRTPRPQALFIELQALLGNSTKNHRAQTTVAQRERSFHARAGWRYQSLISAAGLPAARSRQARVVMSVVLVSSLQIVIDCSDRRIERRDPPLTADSSLVSRIRTLSLLSRSSFPTSQVAA